MTKISALALTFLVVTVAAWTALATNFHGRGLDWLISLAILSAVAALFFSVFAIAELVDGHKKEAGPTPLIRPSETVVITKGLSVSVPVFDILSRQSQEFVVLTQRTITTKYRNGTATLVPQPCSPGIHSYETQFTCSGCNKPVQIELKQATVLPVRRSQLGFSNGRHNPLTVALAVIFSSTILKIAMLLMISFFVSPIIYLQSSIHSTPGILPYLAAWGIAAVIVAVAYILYVGFRLLCSQQILLPVTSRRHYGYGSPDCFNIIIWAMITNKDRSNFHASDLANLNECYESKLLYSRYNFGIPTWVATRH